jgi:hypothetical protein
LQGLEAHNAHVVQNVPVAFNPGGIYRGAYNNTVSGIYKLSITATVSERVQC